MRTRAKSRLATMPTYEMGDGWEKSRSRVEIPSCRALPSLGLARFSPRCSAPPRELRSPCWRKKCMLRQDLPTPSEPQRNESRGSRKEGCTKRRVARETRTRKKTRTSRARTHAQRERERETQTRHAREETARDARLSPSKDPVVARIVSPARVVRAGRSPVRRFTGEHSRRALRAEKRKERRLQSWLPSSSAAA